MKTIREVDLHEKTVLVRVDYNVPMKDGKILDDLRVLASLPTLQFLREAGAKKIILISHLGRPKEREKELSLAPVAKLLEKKISRVKFVDETIGERVSDVVGKLAEGEILLLENLRFDKREEENSEEFAKEIIKATGAEIFVEDGFAVVHRAHTSTSKIAELLPAYAGLLVEKEVQELSEVLKNPERPLLLIIGGAKVEDKKPLIEKFLDFADKILVGGKIAVDGGLNDAEKIYIAEDFDENNEGLKLDIGPVATAKFAEKISEAKTIVWNGLLGKAEDPAYATASTIVAEMMGEKREGETIVCGGDTTGFVLELMKEKTELKYDLISTGGGASLEFLLNPELPGLKVLD